MALAYNHGLPCDIKVSLLKGIFPTASLDSSRGSPREESSLAVGKMLKGCIGQSEGCTHSSPRVELLILHEGEISSDALLNIMPYVRML